MNLSKLQPWVATALLPLLLTATGCDSSNATAPKLADSPATRVIMKNDAQFTEADPAGQSWVERLSYPTIRDLSRELVSASYLDVYFDIDSFVGALMNEAVDHSDGTPYACPDGGTLSVTVTMEKDTKRILRGRFADCAIRGSVLFGTLEREMYSQVFKTGSSLFVAVNFELFDIDAGERGQLLISGKAMRARKNASPEADVKRGLCELDGSDVRLTQVNEIHTARVEKPGIAGSVAISKARYERDDERSHDATSNDTLCPEERSASEAGEAVVTFSGYGASQMDGRAVITTRIGTDGATQHTELPDGSTLRISELPDEDDSAQIDVHALGMASSFIDAYRFQAPDFRLWFRQH